jgi:hypothetical protein
MPFKFFIAVRSPSVAGWFDVPTAPDSTTDPVAGQNLAAILTLQTGFTLILPFGGTIVAVELLENAQLTALFDDSSTTTGTSSNSCIG